MAIENGNVADADEVLNAFGLLFKNMAQPFFDRDYEGWQGGLPTVSKFKYLAAKSGDNYKAEYDSSSSTVYVGNAVFDNTYFYAATTVDDCNDSSIDTSVWSYGSSGLGSVSETTTLKIDSGDGSGGGSAYAIANQTNATDLKATITEVIVGINYLSGYSTGGTGSCSIYLTDGSNNVLLFQMKNNGTETNSGSGYIRVISNPSTNKVRVYSIGISGGGGGTVPTNGSEIDCSSLGSNWWMKFTVGTSYARNRINIYNFAEITGAANSKDYISYATTSSSTITNAITIVNTTLNGGLATYYLSANNGTNWESVTDSQIHRFTNTGTQLKVKITLTEPSTVVYPSTTGTDTNAPLLKEYAVIYNWY